jgi:hypothetical protein
LDIKDIKRANRCRDPGILMQRRMYLEIIFRADQINIYLGFILQCTGALPTVKFVSNVIIREVDKYLERTAFAWIFIVD